jgi:phospholipid N-methyltransferase
MRADASLLLFELDRELSIHLQNQFRTDRRVTVLNTDAADLSMELAKLGHQHCDYVVSGIPFSILEAEKKKQLLRNTFDALKPAPHAAFVIYQVTNELVGHCQHFPRKESEYCLQNIPPMFVTKFYRTANGHAHVNGHNGHSANGRAA